VRRLVFSPVPLPGNWDDRVGNRAGKKFLSSGGVELDGGRNDRWDGLLLLGGGSRLGR
jgi:hypothetical protein